MAIRFPYMNRYGVDPNDDKDDPFRRQERPDTLVSPPDTTVASASAELRARADSILGITREPTVASASAELRARADSILGITREPAPGLVPEPSSAVPAYAFSPAVQAERSGTGLTSILTSGTPPTGQLSPTAAFSPAVQAEKDGTGLTSILGDEKETNFLESGLRSLFRYPGTLVEGVGGTIEAVSVDAENRGKEMRARLAESGLRAASDKIGYDPLDSHNYLRDLGKVIGDQGQRMVEAFPRSPSQATEHPFRDDPLRFLAENLPEQAAQVASQVVLGGAVASGLGRLATGVKSARNLRFAGFAAPTAALETGGTFRQALERHESEGMDYDEASRMAAQEALVTGLGNTALEYLPFVGYMDKVMPGAGNALHQEMVKKLGRLGTAAVVGGGTESVQEALQEVWASVSADLAGKDPEAWNNIAGRMGTSALLALMVGGGAGVIRAPAAERGPGIRSDSEGRIIYPDAPTIGPQVRFDDLGRPIPTTVSEPVIEPTPTAIPAPTLSLDERIEAATRIDPQDRMPRPRDPSFYEGQDHALAMTKRKEALDRARYEARVEKQAQEQKEAVEKQEGDFFPETLPVPEPVPIQGPEESREAYRERVIEMLEESDRQHIELQESNAERLRAMPEDHQEFLLDKWEASPVESFERLRDIIGEQEQRIADGKPAQEEFSPELLARLQVLVDSDHVAAKYAATFQRLALGGTNAYTAESLEEQVSTIEGKIRGDIPMGSVEQQPSTDPEVLDLFSKPRAKPARVPEPEISTPSEVAPGAKLVVDPTAAPPVTATPPTVVPTATGGQDVVRKKLGGEPVPVPTTEPKVTSLLDEPTISRTKQAAFYLNPMAEGDAASAADVEPERFQYKDFKNKKGETHVLKDVTKWMPERSGVIAVWRDPADNRYKVINGHQRWALAQRLGITEIRAIEIPAENAEEARARGALMNIGEGSGTAIDAAKVMRDTNLTPTDLKAQGVSLRGQLVKDATALANLPDGLFSLVAREKIPIRRAVSLGKADLTHSQQWAVWEKVKAEEAEGRKRVSNDELEEMARFVKAAPLIKSPDAPAPKTGDQPLLFGEEYIPPDLSLAVPKARLSAWAKKELARVANNFKFNSNVARAEMLKAAEVGELDPNLAGEIAKKAEAVKAVYNTLSDKAGPISNALNRAALRLHEGGVLNDVQQELITDIKAAVAEELGTDKKGQQAEPSGPEVIGAVEEVRGEETGPVDEGPGLFGEVTTTASPAAPTVASPPTTVTAPEPGQEEIDKFRSAYRDITEGRPTPGIVRERLNLAGKTEDSKLGSELYRYKSVTQVGDFIALRDGTKQYAFLFPNPEAGFIPEHQQQFRGITKENYSDVMPVRVAVKEGGIWESTESIGFLNKRKPPEAREEIAEYKPQRTPLDREADKTRTPLESFEHKGMRSHVLTREDGTFGVRLEAGDGVSQFAAIENFSDLDEARVYAKLVIDPEAVADYLRRIDDVAIDMAVEIVGGKKVIKMGVDSSLAAKLQNLYQADYFVTAIKELIQNHVDATRGVKGGFVNVSVNTGEGSITVVDNGKGMTPAVLTGPFVDIGGSGKQGETDTGAYGFAKASYFTPADKIEVTTVAEDDTGIGLPLFRNVKRLRSGFTATGEEWANTGIVDNVLGKPTEDPTGTTVKLTYAPQYDEDKRSEGALRLGGDHEWETQQRKWSWMSAEEWARNFLAIQRTGVDVSVVIDGKKVKPYHWVDVETTEEPIQVITVPGANLVIRTGTKVVEDRPEVHVLNRGQYQFSAGYDLGNFALKKAEYPAVTTIDISSTVKVEDKNYPFVASREGVKGETQKAVKEYINQLKLAGALKRAQQMMNAMDEFELIGGTEVPVYRTYENVDRAVEKSVANLPVVQNLGVAIRDGFDLVMADMVKRGRIPEGSMLSRFKFGMGFAGKWRGLNISGTEVESLSTGDEKLAPEDATIPNVILINPFNIFSDAEGNADIDPADTTPQEGYPNGIGYLYEPLTAEGLADSTWNTITHELGHQNERNHKNMWRHEHAKLNSYYLRDVHQKEILDALTEAWDAFLSTKEGKDAYRQIQDQLDDIGQALWQGVSVDEGFDETRVGGIVQEGSGPLGEEVGGRPGDRTIQGSAAARVGTGDDPRPGVYGSQYAEGVREVTSPGGHYATDAGRRDPSLRRTDDDGPKPPALRGTRNVIREPKVEPRGVHTLEDDVGKVREDPAELEDTGMARARNYADRYEVFGKNVEAEHLRNNLKHFAGQPAHLDQIKAAIEKQDELDQQSPEESHQHAKELLREIQRQQKAGTTDMSLSGPFGITIRERRELLRGAFHDAYSLRRVAQRMGIQPSYLSRIERGDVEPPSEKVTRKLALELNFNPDELLASAGKVSSDLKENILAMIQERPDVWANLSRELGLREDFAELDTDLFGEPIVSGPAQGDILPESEGPQGISAATDHARAVTSLLKGQYESGALSSHEMRRYEEARKLLRFQEGKGIDPATIQSEAGTTPTDEFTIDMFPSPTSKEVREQMVMTFGSVDAGSKVVNEIVELDKKFGDLATYNLPGVMGYSTYVEAVEQGIKNIEAWTPMTGHNLAKEDGSPDSKKVTAIMSVARNPKFEHSHALAIDKNGFVVWDVLSKSGSLGSVSFDKMDLIKANGKAKESGGKVFIGHNHPSGKVKPSQHDIDTTRYAIQLAQAQGTVFGGHYIVNHNKAMVITAENIDAVQDMYLKKAEEKEFVEQFGVRLKGKRDALEWTSPDAKKVGNPTQMMEYLKALPEDESRIDIMFMSSTLTVLTYQSRHVEELATMSDWVLDPMREVGSVRLILGVNGKAAFDAAVAAAQTVPADIVEVVDVTKPAETARAQQLIPVRTDDEIIGLMEGLTDQVITPGSAVQVTDPVSGDVSLSTAPDVVDTKLGQDPVLGVKYYLPQDEASRIERARKKLYGAEDIGQVSSFGETEGRQVREEKEEYKLGEDGYELPGEGSRRKETDTPEGWYDHTQLPSLLLDIKTEGKSKLKKAVTVPFETAPAKFLAEKYSYYQESLIEVVRRQGGATGVEIAERGERVVDQTKLLLGRWDKARSDIEKLVSYGFKAQSAINYLQTPEKPAKGQHPAAVYSRIQGAVEGKIPLENMPKRARQVVEAIRELNSATGKHFQEIGLRQIKKEVQDDPQFSVMLDDVLTGKAKEDTVFRLFTPAAEGKVFLRMMTPHLKKIWMNPTTELRINPEWNQLVEMLAAENNMDAPTVGRIFNSSRQNASKRMHAEIPRAFKNFPTEMKMVGKDGVAGSGKPVPLLWTHPTSYAVKATAGSAHRAAFIEEFGQGLDDTTLSDAVSSAQQAGINPADTERLMRALGGLGEMSPMDDQDSPSHDIIGGFGHLMSIPRAMLLTRAFVPNTFEVAGNIQAFGGGPVRLAKMSKKLALATGADVAPTARGLVAQAPLLRQLMKTSVKLAESEEGWKALQKGYARQGLAQTWVMNATVDRQRPFYQSVPRIFREYALRAFPTVQAWKIQEMQAAAMGMVLADDMRAAAKPASSRLPKTARQIHRRVTDIQFESDLFVVKHILGFNDDQVLAFRNKEATDEMYVEIARRFASRSNTTRLSLPGEESRAANSPVFNQWIAFHRYSMMSVRNFDKLNAGFRKELEIYKNSDRTKKDKNRVYGAVKTFGLYQVGKTESGLGSILLLALLGGGLMGLGKAFDDILENPVAFMADAYASSQFGPIMNGWQRIVTQRKVENVWMLSAPASIMVEMGRFAFGTGKYQYMNAQERVLAVGGGMSPGPRAVWDVLASVGMTDTDPERDLAITRYWEFLRENDSFSGPSDFGIATKEDRKFRSNMRRAYDILGKEKATSTSIEKAGEYVERALEVEGKETSNVAASIRSRRLLPRVPDEQMDDLRKYLGPDLYSSLEQHDAIMTSWANSASGTRPQRTEERRPTRPTRRR